MKKLCLVTMALLSVCGASHAQYDQVQKVQPVQQWQPQMMQQVTPGSQQQMQNNISTVNDYQNNLRNNAERAIPAGNAIGRDRVIPSNNMRQYNQAGSLAEQNGVAVQQLRKKNNVGQKLINQTLNRDPSAGIQQRTR